MNGDGALVTRFSLLQQKLEVGWLYTQIKLCRVLGLVISLWLVVCRKMTARERLCFRGIKRPQYYGTSSCTESRTSCSCFPGVLGSDLLPSEPKWWLSVSPHCMFLFSCSWKTSLINFNTMLQGITLINYREAACWYLDNAFSPCPRII